MTKDEATRDISCENLRNHNIFYEPEVYTCKNDSTPATPHGLPDHVDAVREALLTFESIIPQEWEDHLREELDNLKLTSNTADPGPAWTHHPPPSALVREKRYERDIGEHSIEWKTAHESLKCSEKIATRAREPLADLEAGWNIFWRTNIFKLFSDEARMQPSFRLFADHVQPYVGRFFIVRIQLTKTLAKLICPGRYESVTWNACDPLDVSLFFPKRTYPKPDLTYAFPIQRSVPLGPKGFARDEFRRCLDLEVIGDLNRQGVFCAPTTGLQNWTRTSDTKALSSSDLSCFPWAVVEMKHATVPDEAVEKCYCQAANAAATALKLQAQLFDKSGMLSEAPPIIAFTCVGPNVKVWLAYQDKQSIFAAPKQRMVCIWSTSVLLTWGVASLRAIIMNMHVWAARLLKPKIQACIVAASGRVKKIAPSTLPCAVNQNSAASLISSSQISTLSTWAFRPNQFKPAQHSPSPWSGTSSISLPTSVQTHLASPFANLLGKASDNLTSSLVQVHHTPLFGHRDTSGGRKVETASSPCLLVPANQSNSSLSANSVSSKPQAKDSSSVILLRPSAKLIRFKATGLRTATNGKPTASRPSTSLFTAQRHSPFASKHKVSSAVKSKKDTTDRVGDHSTTQRPITQEKKPKVRIRVKELTDALQSATLEGPSRDPVKRFSRLAIRTKRTASENSGNYQKGVAVKTASASCFRRIKFPIYNVKPGAGRTCKASSKNKDGVKNASSASGSGWESDHHSNNLSESEDSIGHCSYMSDHEHESEDDSENESDASGDDSDNDRGPSKDDSDNGSDTSEGPAEGGSDKSIHDSDTDQENSADELTDSGSEEIARAELRRLRFSSSGWRSNALSFVIAEQRVDVRKFEKIIRGFSPGDRYLLFLRVWGKIRVNDSETVLLSRVVTQINHMLASKGRNSILSHC